MIPDKWIKVASIAAGTLSVVVTLIQVGDLPVWLRIVVGGVTLGSALLATLFYFQSRRYENALRWAAKLPETVGDSRSADFTFGPAASEAAFAEVCRTSAKIYGESNVPLERTLKWWRQFPEGVFAAYHEPPRGTPELAAYLSAWPIKSSTYAKLRAGKLRERDLSNRSIEGINSSRPRQFWYVANIVVGKRYRKSAVLRLLLQHATRHWLKRGQLAQSVSVVALAFSPDGAALLRRFGFLLLLESSADGWPVYELESTLATIGDRIGGVPLSTEAPPPNEGGNGVPLAVALGPPVFITSP